VPLAYLVLAHGQPEQAARLVRRLTTPQDLVVVHVDRKAELAPFRAAFAAAGVSPLLVHPRKWVAWGGWGIVRATLAGMRAAVRSGHDFTHLILLSGGDYPIRSTAEIQAFFEGQPHRSFISWSLGGGPVMTDEERRGNAAWYWSGDMTRLGTWCISVRGRRWHLPNERIPVSPPLPIPPGLVPAQGSAWWNLSREAVEYSLRYLRRRPDVRTFFRVVFAPDENVFQMLLLQSPLRDRLVNEDLRFMHWAGNSPPTLGLEDVEEMVASKKLFARKFEATISAQALDELDRRALAYAG